jgi:hypothetical protein
LDAWYGGITDSLMGMLQNEILKMKDMALKLAIKLGMMK